MRSIGGEDNAADTRATPRVLARSAGQALGAGASRMTRRGSAGSGGAGARVRPAG